MSELALTTLVVRDYDDAIAFYTGALGFELREDTPLGGGKRWVVVAPAGSTGGRVAFFLHTDDFARDHDRMTAAGVRFVRKPQRETWGMVAVFEDLYGNRWDLIEPST